MKPSILIIHASGTNRDQEAAWACELAGGAPEIVHINQLRAGERTISHYQMVLLPGGFSYGDALGAGNRWALDMQHYFEEPLREFVEQKKSVLGICNGFQTLVKAGLLPGWDEDNNQTNKVEGVPTRSVTLTENERGRFECRWVHLAVEPNCVASALRAINEPIFCPVAHGEGNFQATEEAVERLETNGLVALRYVTADGQAAGGEYPLNPNGSVQDIAGICNAHGNVIGLMPHPEDHIIAAQNPLGRLDGLGLQLFKSLIAQC